MNYAKKIGNTDKTLISFLSDVDSGKRNIKDIDSYMQQASSSTTAFASTLKSVAANMGIMLAVNAGIKILTTIWDELNVTAIEVQDNIDGITSKLNELNAEYEELNSRNPDSLSQSEKDRLQYLDDRIAREERLLEIEKARKDEELVGNGFTDFFDKDNYRRQYYDSMSGTPWKNVVDWFKGGSSDNYVVNKNNTEAYLESYARQKGHLDKLKDSQKGLNKNSEEYLRIQNEIDSTMDGMNGSMSVMEEQLLSFESFLLNDKAVIEEMDRIISDPNTTSKTLEDAKETKDIYENRLQVTQYYIDELNKILKSPQAAIESLDERLNNISSDELSQKFTDQEIELLASLAIDPEASIEDLRTLLDGMQTTADENPVEVITTFSGLMSDASETSFIKSVDTHIDKVNKLNDAYTKLKNGNFGSSDFIELVKIFPELADDSDNLSNAIVNLLNNMNADIVDSFNDQFGNLDTEEDKEALRTFQDAVLELGNVVGNTEFSIDINAETEGMNKLFTSMKESVSSIGLTSESIKALKERYQDLDNYDPSKLFERTYNGIHLNTKALRELETAYENQKKASIDNDLEELTRQYDALTTEINNCSDATQNVELYKKRDDIVQQIEDTATLAAQYEGLTSAFYKWEQAQSIGEEGDMYDSLAGGLENVKELYDQGLIGTNKFRTAVQLMSNEDLSNASVDELLAAYEKGYPLMQRYFQDSSDGCLTFLNDLHELNSEWVKLNEDGSWDINFGMGNDEEIAEKLGINVEAVQAIMRKLSDYAFDINLDSVYSNLETLRNKAEEANKSLLDMGKIDTAFDFSTTSLEFLDAQIEKATQLLNTFRNEDGSVNLSVEGAEEAQIALASLITQKQQLNEPAIMSIDTTEASADMQNAIQLLRDFQTNYNDLEIQTAIGADTSQAQTNIQNIINSLSDVPDEIKTALGLDDTKLQEALADLSSTELNVEAGVNLKEESLSTVTEKISGITPEMVVGVDQNEVDKFKSENHDVDSTVEYDVEHSAVDDFKRQDHSIDSEIRYNAKVNQSNINIRGTTTSNTRSARADGTLNSHASGTNVAIKKDEDAIVNELGEEGLIRNGVLTRILGGMQKLRLKAGDIILNHKQMEELDKNGYVTSNNGRAKQIRAFSSGSGKFVIKGSVKTTPSGSSNKSSSKSNDSSSKDKSTTEKDTTKTYDWIEKAITRVKEAYERLQKVASSVYRVFTKRNGALAKEFDNIRAQINLNQQAYAGYMQKANSVGLPDFYKNLVQNGGLRIEDITDETLQKQIEEYTEWCVFATLSSNG